MSNTNVVVLSGRLTRDPEQRYTPSGKSVTSFGLAVNSSFNGNDYVDFFDIEAWNGLGDAVAKHRTKSDQVIVHGELRQQRWTDQGGNKRSKVIIRASRVEFIWNNKTDDQPAPDKTDTADEQPDTVEPAAADEQPDTDGDQGETSKKRGRRKAA
jgi:single-strand DNA-binding protein